MNKLLRVFLIVGPIAGVVIGIVIDKEFLNTSSQTAASSRPSEESALEHAAKHLDPTYVCPMHSEIVSNEEGSCPICGMDLVPVKKTEVINNADDKHPVVEVSPAIINSLGVRTVKLERKDIARRVETPGFVQQIKKGKMTTYRAPFDARVTAIYLEPEHWYEQSKIPLLELSSEQYLQAQKTHVEIFNNTEEKKPGADNQQQTETTPPVISKPENSQPAFHENGLLDSDGRLSGEYREQLYAMGHDDESIAEIEKEMRQTLGLDQTKAGTDTQQTNNNETEKAASETTTEKAAEQVADDKSTLSLEESRNKLKSMGMSVEQISRLENTGIATDKYTIYTNGKGRVMKMSHKVGDTLSKGERLFQYGGEVRAVVLANAFQRDAAWITTGQRVEIRLPHDKSVVWPGIVNQGAVSINPDSQNIGIRLSFSAPLDKIRSNMYVRGTIFGSPRKNVIAVPTQSIIRTEGEDRVILALGNGRFKPVTVKPGVEAGELTEIVEGLEEGDEVVVMAQFLIDSESSLQASMQRLNSMTPVTENVTE